MTNQDQINQLETEISAIEQTMQTRVSNNSALSLRISTNISLNKIDEKMIKMKRNQLELFKGLVQ